MLILWGFGFSSEASASIKARLWLITASASAPQKLRARQSKARRNKSGEMGARPLTTDPQHRDGGLVQLDEDAVVDLPQTEQLQHLLHLGRNLKLEELDIKFQLRDSIYSPG